MYIARQVYNRYRFIVALLRWGCGALLFFSGFDKIADITHNPWIELVSLEIEQTLPFSFAHVFLVLSIIQMSLGLMFFFPRLAKWAAYGAALLLVGLSVDLLLAHLYYERVVINTALALVMFIVGNLIAIQDGVHETAQHD